MATTCTNCGCSKPKCGCQDTMLTSPAPCPTPVGCPDRQPCSEVFDAECIVYTGPDLECGDDTVVIQNSAINLALEDIVGYFCNLASLVPITIVAAGNGIDVTPVTVGTTTTYTVATETPLLRKFVYEETLPDGNPNQQITILNTVYSPCGIPTVGCDGTLTAVPTVVDLIIQGYWFNIDENAWIEFTHNDKTGIGIDLSGDIGIFPAFDPPPVDLDLPVRIRITIIG
jgi:hypothetical protein